MMDDADLQPVQPYTQMLSPSEMLGDQNRYRLQQKLGEGGMGEVFLATDTRLNKQVAVKVLSPNLITSEAARQRFQQECAICAALESPHIVQVSDYGITAGYPFYVMEYLQGETLSERLARTHRLTLEQVSTILRQICAGLQVAHAGVILQNQETPTHQLFKVIHRDLKPDNIFLVPTALGELVKIIDFGIAKIRSLQADNFEITQSFLGTSHYAAPEQFETAELDERTDIYSLGLILYEMLSGTDPYGLGFNRSANQPPVSDTDWLTAHLTLPPLPLRIQPGCEQLPSALETLISRCLAKSPAERFTSTEVLNQTFQAAITKDILPRVPIKILPDQPAQFQMQIDQDFSPDVKISESALESSQLPDYQTKRQRLLQRASALWALPSVVSGLLVGGLTLGSLINLKTFLPSVFPSARPQTEAIENLDKTLVGHQAAIWALALSTDTKTLISGDENGLIKIWDLLTGQIKQTLLGEPKAVRALSLSGDGKLLATGGDKIQIWNMQTGQLEAIYSQPVWTVALSHDHQTLVSGSEDGLIRMWNLDSGQFRPLAGHQAAVYAVAISAEQNMIVSGSQDKTVKIWDMQSGVLIDTLTGHQDAVRCLAFNTERQLIASGSWDKTVKIWNLQTRTLVHTLKGHQDRVIAIALSKDGHILASASRDKTIKLWDVQTGKLLQSLTGHLDWVLAVEIGSNGETVVSGSSDRTIKIWQ